MAACETSIEVHCSLYERYVEGSYYCFLETNSTGHDVSETSDLDCGTLDDESVECTDLGTAQNAAAINLFLLCSTLLILGLAHRYNDKAVAVQNLLVASMLAEFAACACAFISAGSYRGYIEAVSKVDIYFTTQNGESQRVGTLDVDWIYGYSWILTVMSGILAVCSVCTSYYFYYQGTFRNKTRIDRTRKGGGDANDLPAVRNTLGVPLMPGGIDSDPPSSVYEL